MNQKEKELFLELSKLKAPNEKKIEKLLKDGYASYEVLGMLFVNRMAGVAYHVLNQTKLLDKADREFRNSIKNASVLNQKINDDFRGCINHLTTELESCGVPYALLKGAYLCHWYPKGCRTSNDIDILVAPENVGKISAKLKMAGFRQGYLKNGVFEPATRQQIIESKMSRGETVPFIKETKLSYIPYLEVDINFSLDYKNSDDAVLKEMLSRTQIVTVNSTKVRTLDPCDFLLHLCAHLYKEATTVPWIRMKRDMTFYKYEDIYGLLMDLKEADYNNLMLRAEQYNMKSEVFYCIKSIESLFNLPIFVSFQLTGAELNALNEVVAPAEKKMYWYTESNISKRFFEKDRMKLLEVVE